MGPVITCLNCTYDEIISFGWLSITVGQGGFNIHPETAVFELYIQPMPSCSNLIENKEIDQALVMRSSLIFFYRKNFVKFASERRWPRPNRPSGSARLASLQFKKFNRAKSLVVVDFLHAHERLLPRKCRQIIFFDKILNMKISKQSSISLESSWHKECNGLDKNERKSCIFWASMLKSERAFP